MIPGESSRSEAVSTKAKYTAMHQNEMGVERGGWREAAAKVEREEERGRKKGENVSDSVHVRKEICTRDTAVGAIKRKNNGGE